MVLTSLCRFPVHPLNTIMASNKNENSEQYVPPSNNSIYQTFGGWPGFMHSHGLKPWNDDDVQEGKAIVAGMKAQHRQDWDDAQAALKANKK